MPTVTRGSAILLSSVAMPADTRWAARRDTHSHTCRTAAMSASDACDSPAPQLPCNTPAFDSPGTTSTMKRFPPTTRATALPRQVL
ncbi:unnamed protein product, partial [Iphiclides podalirius]